MLSPSNRKFSSPELSFSSSSSSLSSSSSSSSSSSRRRRRRPPLLRPGKKPPFFEIYVVWPFSFCSTFFSIERGNRPIRAPWRDRDLLFCGGFGGARALPRLRHRPYSLRRCRRRHLLRGLLLLLLPLFYAGRAFVSCPSFFNGPGG
jgi:hypothetical protein